MLIDTCSSNKHVGKRLSVPSGREDLTMLLHIDPDFGSVTLVSANVPITAGTSHPDVDAADVIAQIKQKGHAFHSYRRSRRLFERRRQSLKASALLPVRRRTPGEC